MSTRSMTVGRYEEIRRRLTDGRGVREIAPTRNCSRNPVREWKRRLLAGQQRRCVEPSGVERCACLATRVPFARREFCVFQYIGNAIAC